MKNASRITAMLGLLALAATSCVSRAGASGVLHAVRVSGAMMQKSDGGAWRRVSQGQAIGAGDSVRTGPGGSVKLESGDISFELGEQSQAHVQSADDVAALAGSVLAASKEPVRVDVGDATVSSRDAVVRVDYGERVGVYRSDGTEVRVSVGGEAVQLPQGRQLTLGLDVTDVRAMPIDQDDPWDRRYFADAIQIDRQLQPYSRTFDVNTGGGAKSVDFFARYVAREALGFLGPMLAGPVRTWTKFDVLIGLFIAIERAGGGTATVESAFAEIVGIRSQGGSMGLAALIEGVTASGLLQRVVTAFTPGAAPQKPAPPPPGNGGRPPSGGPTPTPTPGPTGSPTPTNSHQPTPTPTPTPTDTDTGQPSPTPTPTSTCVVTQVGLPCPTPTGAPVPR